MDISVTKTSILTKFKTRVHKIHMEDFFSQNVDRGPICHSFNFMTKKQETVFIFLKSLFLHFIKQKV